MLCRPKWTSVATLRGGTHRCPSVHPTTPHSLSLATPAKFATQQVSPQPYEQAPTVSPPQLFAITHATVGDSSKDELVPRWAPLTAHTPSVLTRLAIGIRPSFGRHNG